jgi:hypothetical protein
MKGKIMKKYIIAGVILLSTANLFANANSNSYTTVIEERGKKVLVIDLDKAKEDGKKGGGSSLLKGIISIGNSDEVKFIGDNTLMARGITITITTKMNKLKKTLVGIFTIKTSELEVGDTIRIKNRRGKVKVEQKIVK